MPAAERIITINFSSKVMIPKYSGKMKMFPFRIILSAEIESFEIKSLPHEGENDGP
jgi:hypothetical protein